GSAEEKILVWSGSHSPCKVLKSSPPSTSVFLPVFRRLPPRPVALVRQAPLAGRFAFRRVRHRVIVIAFGRVVGPPSPLLNSIFRRMRRYQRIAAAADQIGAAGVGKKVLEGNDY